MKKRGVCLLLTLIFALGVLPVTVSAANFTDKMKSRFIEQIIAFGKGTNPYRYYALHDLDGDNVPELLMGRRNNDNSNFVYYIVWKYDSSHDRFVNIGTINETRYLMKDKYSNALIAVYGNDDCKVYFNFYISDNKVHRNTKIMSVKAGVGAIELFGTRFAVYNTDGSVYMNEWYTRNDMGINRATFLEDEVNMLGSYEELIVHDWRGFEMNTAVIAVNSWRTHVVTQRPITFSSNDKFTATWQKPMYDLIESKIGPANTLIREEDLYDIETNPAYMHKVYRRFALHDIDGDAIPELFLGVQDMEYFMFDIYKHWNGEMRYIGSVDSYSKYLSSVTNSRDVFAYNPSPNEFYLNSARRVRMENNLLQFNTLLGYYRANGVDTYYTVNNTVSNPAFPGTLRSGSKGSSVTSLQTYLNRIRQKYTSIRRLAVDGNFGTQTKSAVTEFQRAFGLSADGIVNQTTWNKIVSVYNDVIGTPTNIGEDAYAKQLASYVIAYNEIRTFDIYMVPPSAALIMYVKTRAFTLR